MRRIFASFMLSVIMISSFCMTSAAEAESYRASSTLSRYYAELFSGNSKGEVVVSFDVKANLTASSVGIESIDFYTDDGEFVESVSGSTSNGLIDNSTGFHGGDFEYDLPPGESYYAEVTVFARIGSDYDSRTVTTSTVWVR